MPRKFESGASKRKRLREKEELLNSQKGAILSFLRSSENEGSEEFPRTEGVPQTSQNESETLIVSGDKSKNTEHQNNMENIEGEKEVNEKNQEGFEENIHSESVLTSSKQAITYPTDIAVWPINISEQFIEHILINMPQNIGKIESLKKEYTERNRTYVRNVNESHFYCKKANGTKENREWLIFSETSKAIYCFICKLFSKSNNSLMNGFNDWKNITHSLCDHERSAEHIRAMCTYSKRKSSSVNNRIDSELMKQIQSEENYWREVLKRIIATIKLLSKLGLAFRGNTNDIFSDSCGNYLSCLHYLSEFDDFLKHHIKMYANCGSGRSNYLSYHICDEFIA